MDKDRVEAHCNGEYGMYIWSENTPLLKLRIHAQTRIHAFSAADEENERRRSLCDGGGAAVFWRNTGRKCRELSKCPKYRRHKSTNPAHVSQTVFGAAAANEPMRGERRGRTTARYVAVNNATMAAWLFRRA